LLKLTGPASGSGGKHADLFAVALTLICTAVFGDGSEQWISDAKLVDPVSKAICCGPTDCSVLAPGSVERVQGGYKVNTGWWTGYDPFFVKSDRALPFSPDGHYHICINYDDESVIAKIRCFIVPPSAVSSPKASATIAAASPLSPRSDAPRPQLGGRSPSRFL